MSSHRSSQRPREELPSTPYGDLVPAREDLQLALKDKARRIMRRAHLPEAQVAGLSQPDIFIHLAGLSEPIRGTLRGLFKGTLHVASSQSIIPSLNVTITFGDAAIRGSVAYCISKGSHYLVSIAVSPLTADSDDVNGRFRRDVNKFSTVATLDLMMMPRLFTSVKL